MTCKWDILDSVNPSMISMADVLGVCHCSKCEKKQENKKKRKVKKRNG